MSLPETNAVVRAGQAQFVARTIIVAARPSGALQE